MPVRRLALFIEESLRRGTSGRCSSRNDEPLWSQLRLSVGAFMHQLFRQGAFQGASPARGVLRQVRRRDHDARPTSTRASSTSLVGFAPLKPAEFVIIKLQQLAGQSGS